LRATERNLPGWPFDTAVVNDAPIFYVSNVTSQPTMWTSFIERPRKKQGKLKELENSRQHGNSSALQMPGMGQS
jgi:hypothetical protein